MNCKTVLFELFIIILVCKLSALNNLGKSVDDYEKLIAAHIKNANKFKPRTDNSDFYKNQKKSNTDINNYGEFDFIVVGGGSAGGVLASKLAEIKDWNILLLEAGEAEDSFSLIPGFFRFLENSDKSWGYTSTRQKHGCFGMKKNSCPYVRGKSLGGTGAINGLIYIRGNKNDYDKWANFGNPGWSYDDVLPYFKKMENSHIPEADEGYHGFSGPIPNVYSSPETKFEEIILQAGVEMGLKPIDYNGQNDIGISRMQNNLDHGSRVSAGISYVVPAQKLYPNFNVTLGAYVTKILIRDGAAYGVQFVKDGRQYSATTRKEVIISGGSVNTPQLLMLSGIGPTADLAKIGIESVVNLPVGKVMKDHPAYTFLFLQTNDKITYGSNHEIIRQYVEDGEGILTVPFGFKNVAFVNVDDPNSQIPNVEIILAAPGGKYPGFPPTSRSNLGPDLISALSRVNSVSDIKIGVYLLHPKSTGKITLKSKNPVDFPEIDIGILTHPDDTATLIKGIRYAIKMTETPAFRAINATVFFPYKPCLRLFAFNSDGFWECAIQHVAVNGYHMTSTAKMGPINDPLAVVDNKLKVHGVNNLRVADCSVVPVTIGGHLNVVAWMIGEKAADIIKDEYMNPPIVTSRYANLNSGKKINRKKKRNQFLNSLRFVQFINSLWT